MRRQGPASGRAAALRIDRVEVRRLGLPLLHPFETSFGRATRKELLLVSVSAAGVTGHGECVADTDPFYLPETLATAHHVLKDFLAPMAFSTEIAHPRDLARVFAPVRGHEMAKAALEMAAWELQARLDGVPLYALLGGREGSIPAGVSIGIQKDEAALVGQVETELQAGYRRIKIKIKPRQDLDLVAAVRRRFPDIPLMADANSAYTLDDAPLFEALDAFGLMMVEQPLGWDDMLDHAALQRRIRTPLCLDESIHSARDVRNALHLGACGVINLKPGRVGGFSESLAVHDLCRFRGLPLWCGGMLETGIGRLHNVHLQTLPGFTLPGDTSASSRYFREDLVDPPVTVSRDGLITVPVKPGIGHEIMWKRVDKATSHREEWRRG